MNPRKRQPKPTKPAGLVLVQEFPLKANGELPTSHDLGKAIPAEPGIWRKVNGEYVRVPDPKPSPRPIGNLPLNLKQGGLDALLWPWFKRWIENSHHSVMREWQSIADPRRFFVDLCLCAMFDQRFLAAKPHRKRAEAISPEIMRRVLPVLRRRLQTVTPEDYEAATRNPNPDGKKFTRRQYDKRAKIRQGLKTLPKFSGPP